jgi:hypothetical protein
VLGIGGKLAIAWSQTLINAKDAIDLLAGIIMLLFAFVFMAIGGAVGLYVLVPPKLQFSFEGLRVSVPGYWMGTRPRVFPIDTFDLWIADWPVLYGPRFGSLLVRDRRSGVAHTVFRKYSYTELEEVNRVVTEVLAEGALMFGDATRISTPPLPPASGAT